MKKSEVRAIVEILKGQGTPLSELQEIVLDVYNVKTATVAEKATSPKKTASKGYVVTFDGGFPRDVMPAITALGGEYSKEYKGFVCPTKKVADAVANVTVTAEERLQVRRTWKSFKKSAKCADWAGNGTVRKITK